MAKTKQSIEKGVARYYASSEMVTIRCKASAARIILSALVAYEPPQGKGSLTDYMREALIKDLEPVVKEAIR